jgi:hypothetical protein
VREEHEEEEVVMMSVMPKEATAKGLFLFLHTYTIAHD